MHRSEVHPLDLLSAIVEEDHNLKLEMNELPPPDILKAVASKHAWRFHRACKGRGQVKGALCSCAWKRMIRRALS